MDAEKGDARRLKKAARWFDDLKGSKLEATLIEKSLRKTPMRFRAIDIRITFRGTTWRGRAASIATVNVVKPPGYRWSVVLRFLLTRPAYKRYVEPVIADMQEEYIDALAAGHLWHARWIAIRGHIVTLPNWLYAFMVGKISELLKRGR